LQTECTVSKSLISKIVDSEIKKDLLQLLFWQGLRLQSGGREFILWMFLRCTQRKRYVLM